MKYKNYGKRKFHSLFPFLTALKIHVSPATKSVLDQFSSFILETRGETEMKVRSLVNFKYIYGRKKYTKNMAIPR